MDRREFLKCTVPVSTIPFLLGGIAIRAYSRSPILDALTAGAVATDRVLVLVQLNGGNDGLNTVIPLDQYSALSTARPTILIPEAKVLRLSDATGLHPAMTGLQSLFADGRLAVVQGVSYPNPNLSHFRATDIWLTAADSTEVLTSGWLGRYLDQEFPGYPVGYPNTDVPDPVAIQIGSVVSPVLQGPAVSLGMAVTNTSSTYTLPGGFDIPPDSPAGHELIFIRNVAEQTQEYSKSIKSAASKATNLSTLYPSKGSNSLADQLRIVAQLVAGGLQTRIYVVTIGGFDTHSAQVVASATDTGTHATLLGRLSTAITAFQDDLRLLGIDGRVMGVTFSEFGRRIISNASNGTDHGTAAPLFVFGRHVNPGILGTNPVIPPQATSKDNLPMQVDFRGIYLAFLKDWFGAQPPVVAEALPHTAAVIPVVSRSASLGGETSPESVILYQNYPNPFNPSTRIRYEISRAGYVNLEVFNEIGQRIAVLVDGEQSAGIQNVTFDARNFSSGIYFYRLRAGGFTETKRLVLVR
jgi:uncharacterized protein (DUF1501 family)